MSLVREQVSRGPCRWRDRPLERLSEREHRHRVSNRRLAELERARERRVSARAATMETKRARRTAQGQAQHFSGCGQTRKERTRTADRARARAIPISIAACASGVKRVDDRTAMLQLMLGSQRVEGERGEGADDEGAADQRRHRRDAGAQQEVEQRDEDERTQVACAVSTLHSRSIAPTDCTRQSKSHDRVTHRNDRSPLRQQDHEAA